MKSAKSVNAILICAALAAATLTGCTGLHADVHAATPATALPGERTYSFARMPTQGASSDHAQFETALRDELAKQGFADTADRPAHYVLSVGYETRLAEIGVGRSDCTAGDCGRQSGAPFSLFGARAYHRHTLTLRFFERVSGREIYKVSAASTDRDPDPLQAAPALIKSALAQFPFQAPADWRVKLRMDEARGVPDVVSVQPLDR
ncbi:MAG: Probable lipoprotein transmembrane [uncultured Paraburkholderia sp.]|nr:MAG: Probable lipoprotein transmembrane [uncultured Paraburkholderia sp.]